MPLIYEQTACTSSDSLYWWTQCTLCTVYILKGNRFLLPQHRTMLCIQRHQFGMKSWGERSLVIKLVCWFPTFEYKNQGVVTPQNPVILLDTDNILMRSYSVHRAGWSTVQISVLPWYFCLAHAKNGKSHRHFKNFSATLFGASFSISK